ncbi:MAG TPA: hypothetical protein VKB79_11060 [Bryobacteraceae bacterium]|nr:hypothetical protein [Bryobacteraceae bacterium]
MKQQDFPRNNSADNSGEGKCPLLSEETPAALLDFAAGRLDGICAEQLARHSAHCEACADFIAGQAAAWSALDEWEIEPVSSAFNRRFWARAAELDRIPWYLRLADAVRFGGWKPAIPVAAAVLVIAAGFLMDHRDAVRTTRTGAGNGVSVIEVDQVERSLDDIQLLKQFDTTVTDAATSSTRM